MLNADSLVRKPLEIANLAAGKTIKIGVVGAGEGRLDRDLEADLLVFVSHFSFRDLPQHFFAVRFL